MKKNAKRERYNSAGEWCDAVGEYSIKRTTKFFNDPKNIFKKYRRFNDCQCEKYATQRNVTLSSQS